MEVPAPFSERKRRHNPASLNRRESYIHKKMNASDFFDFCLKKICLTFVKVGAYRKLDIFGPECINFCISAWFLKKFCNQLRIAASLDTPRGNQASICHSNRSGVLRLLGAGADESGKVLFSSD